MPAPQATPLSPPPPQASLAGSSKTPPPPPSPSSSSFQVHQVGSRQATRSRTRTRRNMSSSANASHRTPRYTNEDHPMAPHNLTARGYHSFRCLGVPFNVKQRYTFVRELGIGAYGCVALCHDEVLDCNVAIKKVTRIFDKDVLARRALREVALLRHVGMCDNVTALLDFDTAFIDFSEIYLVLSASEADLSQIIRSGQALSDAHHQYFMAQILRGVRYMHAAKVIHRDLKPSNLLVNGDCALRICDFGLARAWADSDQFTAAPLSNDESDANSNTSNATTTHDSTNKDGAPQDLAQSPTHLQPQQQSAQSPSPASDLHVQLYKTDVKGKQKRLNFPGGPLTGYVATRWYRAPEVMLCFREGYGPEMDMWSVGCILAELIAGAPIFGGKDYVDQIARINNVLGSPSEAVLDKIGSERAKTYIKSLPSMPAVPLEKLYPNANAEALDLVAKLLTWDPDQRLTAEEALQHPWLKAYHESNARWQPPQPFDKFVEVELIHTLRQFKGSLQREADEMRLELEELEKEEMEHLGANDQHQTDASSQSAHQDAPSHPHDQNHAGAAEPSQENTDADSGNVQRADDAFDTQALRESVGHVEADARSSFDDDDHLSCNASTQSGHLPADTASSSSSVHTPSSTSGASADEAESPSPRMYDATSCRMSETALKARAEHLGEGEALRKAPSFFRLGHEGEGTFMPQQDVLTVARGLVEYQFTANAIQASGEETLLSNTNIDRRDQSVGMTRNGTIKASTASNGSNVGGRSGASQSTRHNTGGRGAAGGAASTPCLGQSLLDDILFAPSDGSANGLKSVATQRHGKQLVILQDSLVQSCVALVREMIRKACQRNQAVLVVSTLRRPETYLDGISGDRIASIDATMLANPYAEGRDAIRSATELIGSVQSQLATLNASVSKTMVIIDSLNAIARAEKGGVANATRVVRETLSSVGSSSRVVIELQMGGVEAGVCSALLAALHSPLIWGPSSGTVLTATLHPPAVLRHLFKQFSLRPRSSSAAVRRALGAGLTDEDREQEDVEEVDARFWDVLRNVSSRGPMGVAGYEVGGGAQGWWNGESSAFEGLLIAHEGEEAGSHGVIRLEDVLNPTRTGYVMLELHYQARNGKKYEELVGLASRGSSPELMVVPLDMADRRAEASSSSQAAPAGGDAHSAMVQNLPFNLGETNEQRERRETVPLPYAYHEKDKEEEKGLRGNTGNAKIFFEPEQDDDEDDEDPDDDLDL